MGKHSVNAAESAQRIALETFVQDASHTAVKPGSRRARREAERAAMRTAQETNQAKPVATAADVELSISSPAPKVKDLAGAAGSCLSAAPAIRQAVVSTDKVFAEYMNEHLVLSQVGETELRVKSGLFRNARAAVVALVAVTSVFSIAAGKASFDGNGNIVPAYANADVVDVKAVNAPAVENVSFKVTVDGKTSDFEALSGITIAQALAQAGITLGAQDEISLPLDAQLSEGVSVRIARISTQTVTEEFVDKFVNRDEEDANLDKGEKKIVTPGVDGKGTRTFTVKYRDGQEISREVVAEAITTARQDQITKVGTKEKSESTDSDIAVPPAGPAPTPGSARAIAQQMVASRGWGADQFSCLDRLWQRESGWNAHAMNRSSGAYGIPQSLPGSKMASAGADWQTNPATQIRWGLGYIQGRYGSPCGAWNHSQSVGWY